MPDPLKTGPISKTPPMGLTDSLSGKEVVRTTNKLINNVSGVH